MASVMSSKMRSIDKLLCWMTQIRDGRTIPCEAVRRCMADLEGIPVCLVLVGWLLLATTTGTSESQIHLPDNQRKNNFVTKE
jgi:hypothetical protein